MNIKEQMERGTLHLHPIPTSVNHEDGNYQRTMIINRKNGSHFEILRLTGEHGVPDFRVNGDIPIIDDDIEEYKKELQRCSFSHCELREVHRHEETTDVHPRCHFYSEKQFTEIFPRIFEISQKFSDVNAKIVLEGRQP